MEKKSNSLKYATIAITLIIVLVMGIAIGVSFNNKNNSKLNSKTPTSANITVDQAKDIALKDAKKDFTKDTSLDTDIYVELDREDGKEVYEVSFYLDGVSYEYKVTTSDGKIIDKDREIPTNKKADTNSSNTGKGKSIEQAKKVVLKDTALSEGKVTFTKQKQDIENRKPIFEFQFFTQTKEYEYEIDATTLEILEKEIELRNKVVDGNKNITQDEAKKIALKDANLSEKDVVIKKIELEVEKNYQAYEIEFYKGNKEYDYEIDVASGTILKLSWKLK